MLNRQKIAKEENIELNIRRNKGLQPLAKNVSVCIALGNGLKPIVHGSVSLSQEEVC